jgi:hypothetical protein
MPLGDLAIQRLAALLVTREMLAPSCESTVDRHGTHTFYRVTFTRRFANSF